jgi:hypothetical protein
VIHSKRIAQEEYQRVLLDILAGAYGYQSRWDGQAGVDWKIECIDRTLNVLQATNTGTLGNTKYTVPNGTVFVGFEKPGIVVKVDGPVGKELDVGDPHDFGFL